MIIIENKREVTTMKMLNDNYPFPDCDSIGILMYLSTFGPRTIEEIKSDLDLDLHRTMECLAVLLDLNIITKFGDKIGFNTDNDTSIALQRGFKQMLQKFLEYQLKKLESVDKKDEEEIIFHNIEVILRRFKPLFDRDPRLDMRIKRIIKNVSKKSPKK